ncbi:MAG: lactonase family protein [Rhodospirillaceae bacterium]|nr:lactonase family protein [Rhodospirillaceae bacterium]
MPTLAFVGCLNREAPYFQGARGKGIAVFAFDEDSGRLTALAETRGIDNPTYLSIHAGNGCLYANSEVFGWAEGTVSAYRIDPATGRLTYLNKQPTLGSITAHNSIDRSGRHLLVANYAMGRELPDQSVVVLPIRSDGSLGAPACSRAHEGTGPVASRQERSHAHCIHASPDNRFVFVADLGIDRLVCYRFDGASGELASAGQPTLALKPGSGPRHFVFHPGGRLAYLINELSSTIAALRYDPQHGAFALIEEVPALPPDHAGESHCADIQITPDGRFLYGSNRGHDSIVIHAVDPDSGRLTLVGHQPTLGRTPRSFAIDPSGRFLLAANQNSDSVVVFRIDPATGALAETGERAEVGTPMCVRLARFQADGDARERPAGG